jgi:hypothetical protein
MASLAAVLCGYWAWKNSEDQASVKSVDVEVKTNPYPLHYEEVKALRKTWDNSTLSIGDPAQDLISRAEEIKRIYKDTHYVFIHGQFPDFLPLIDLINALAEKKGIANPHFFKYMRMPVDPQSKNTQADVEFALLAALEGHDGGFASNHVISVDAYFPNKEIGESAYHFLWKKNRSFNFSRVLSDDIKLDDLSAKRIGETISRLGASLNETAPCGNLWVICIPKRIVNQFQSSILYRSHPYGKECRCHAPQRYIEILQSLQDNTLDQSTQCYSGVDVGLAHIFSPVPQYRLVTTEITPEYGALTFLLTPLDKDQRRKIKKTIETEVAQITFAPQKLCLVP